MRTGTTWSWTYENWVDQPLREIEVGEDLYILVMLEDKSFLDLHSRQLDQESEPGVMIDIENELDELIEALMQLRKELEPE